MKRCTRVTWIFTALFLFSSFRLFSQTSAINSLASLTTLSTGIAAPDLVITGQTLNVTTIGTGESILPGFTITNLGIEAADPHKVYFYLSADNNLTPGQNGDTLIGKYAMADAVAANASSGVLSIKLGVPCSLTPGNYFLFFVADGDSSIQESDETNNSIAVAISISMSMTMPVTPVITASPSDSVCSPDPVILSIGKPDCAGCSFVWSEGTVGTSISVTDSGNYYVTATNACGNATDSQLVTIKPLPDVFVNHTPASVCENRFQLLFASGNAQAYTWTGPGLQYTTGTTNVVWLPQIGATQYHVTGTLNGCSYTRLFVLTGQPQPNVRIINPDTAICAGASFKLTATGASLYTWRPATGLNIDAGATVTASPTVNTKYFVNGIGANGCIKQDSVQVNVLPVVAPTVNVTYTGCPANSLTFETTVTNTGTTPQYKWFVNNVQATGTGSTFTLNNAANGAVVRAELTSSAACVNPLVVSSSVTVNCIATAVPNIDGLESFTLAPNPTSGLLIIRYNLRWARKVSFTVFNGMGQKVYHSQSATRAGANTRELHLSHLPNGVYYLQTMMDNKMFVTKIIVQ